MCLLVVRFELVVGGEFRRALVDGTFCHIKVSRGRRLMLPWYACRILCTLHISWHSISANNRSILLSCYHLRVFLVLGEFRRDKLISLVQKFLQTLLWLE